MVLSYFKKHQTDMEKLLIYLKEEELKGNYCTNSMIEPHLGWTPTKTKREVDNLAKNGFILKLKSCPCCGKPYKRIPIQCLNTDCQKILINPHCFSIEPAKFCFFLIILSEDGQKFLKTRFEVYYYGLKLVKNQFESLRQKYKSIATLK